MPNLKLISLKIKSTKNIQKITQSMKMVSAAKFARAERDLKVIRPLGDAAQHFYSQAEVSIDKPVPKGLFVAITSDRGLAGGCHSAVGKNIREKMYAMSDEERNNTKIICVGDKSRGFMVRFFKENLLMVGSEIGRTPPSFGDAAGVANAIMSCGHEFDHGQMLYNKYRTVVSYTTTPIPIFSKEAILGAEKMSAYDSIDADVMQSYVEFSLASMIFYAMKEGACSEQSSRMNAMDSSSKNAGDILDKLTIKFNRTRQAVITGELIEIISGAAAL